MSIKSISSKELWSNYTKFYISQSTAFITPILYIFLDEKFGMNPSSILKISAIYWIMSIGMQLPCGVLADRWGVKKNLYLCLFLQALSCISLLFIQHIAAYHFYLICIYLAEGLCVSASSILIRKQFQDSQTTQFKEYSFKLQNSFYLITSVFILVSSFLFTFNKHIPFVLQIVNFALSAFFLSKIPEQYISNTKASRNIFFCAGEDLRKSFQFIMVERFYLYLIVCLTFFGLGVSINQKAIQIQLFSLFTHNKVMMVGCIIALGNLFSSVGAKLFYSWISRNHSLRTEVAILITMLFLSYLSMSIDSLFAVIIGFMLINLFKGCFRPLIGSELINRYPFNSSRSTNLALVSTLSIIVSSVFQYSIAFFYNDILFGNILFASLTLIILVASGLALSSVSSWCMREETSPLTGKKSYASKRDGELFFAQIYPSSTSDQELQDICDIACKSGYPVQKMISFVKVNGVKGLETKFLGEIHLSDLLDEDKQYRVCERLIDQMKPTHQMSRPARMIREEHIMPPASLEIIKKDPKLSQTCIIHGDLHPGNIMVFDEQPFVIDWDLCGNGPLWYDLLSLLSHPNLYFSKQKRFKLFLRQCEQLRYEDLDLLFHLFCKFKSNQLKNFARHESKYHELVDSYSNQTGLYTPLTTEKSV
ncbi:MAG: hypothetical protein CK425_05690 [Parachlamydia sp.]|nr:MAG: hypothetical protein CK425_05690 [Parachlamydia sp.]